MGRLNKVFPQGGAEVPAGPISSMAAVAGVKIRAAFPTTFHFQYETAFSQAPLAPNGFITGAEYKWITIYKGYAGDLTGGKTLPNMVSGGYEADMVQNTPFGAGATELDALEALHPGALSRILEDEIKVYFDDDLDEEINDMVSQVQDRLLDVEASVQRRYAGEIASPDEEREAINHAFRQVHDPALNAYEAARRDAWIAYESAIDQCREEITRMEADFVARAQIIVHTMLMLAVFLFLPIHFAARPEAVVPPVAEGMWAQSDSCRFRIS